MADEDDLVALAKSAEEDHLSRFLQDHWLLRHRRTSDAYDRTIVFRNSNIVRTVTALDLLLAAVF